jgi:hypothetical protein
MKVNVELTKQESETVFYDILCNCISMGWFNGYGITLDYNKGAYNRAKEKLQNPCVEDVWMQMLRDGEKLFFIDWECDGEYNAEVTLEDVHTKIQTAPLEDIKTILDGTGDVINDDIVLQSMLYGEVIFG